MKTRNIKKKEMTKEDKILKTLKDFGRLATARVAAIIGSDFLTTYSLLEKMNKNKQIIMERETNATYWRLKNENNRGKKIKKKKHELHKIRKNRS